MLNSSESTSQDKYLDTIDDKQLVSLIDDDLITSPDPAVRIVSVNDVALTIGASRNRHTH